LYQRIVCFAFADGAAPEAIQKHMDDFAALAGAVPQIVSYRGGLTTAEADGAPSRYDSLHYLIFGSLPDIDTYFAHPAHQAFIEANQAIWADVLVLNAAFDT
jgi:hypothetical protein